MPTAGLATPHWSLHAMRPLSTGVPKIATTGHLPRTVPVPGVGPDHLLSTQLQDTLTSHHLAPLPLPGPAPAWLCSQSPGFRPTSHCPSPLRHQSSNHCCGVMSGGHGLPCLKSSPHPQPSSHSPAILPWGCVRGSLFKSNLHATSVPSHPVSSPALNWIYLDISHATFSFIFTSS